MRTAIMVMVSILVGACADPKRPSVPVPSGAPGSDDVGAIECVDTSTDICRLEYLVVSGTNRFRQSEGNLPPLTYRGKVGYVARDWSRQQAEAATLSHDGFPIERLKVYENRFPDGEEFKLRAENVLLGHYQTTDPSAIAQIMVNQWAASPDHRAQMLQNYAGLGVGVYFKDNTWYATQLFTE